MPDAQDTACSSGNTLREAALLDVRIPRHAWADVWDYPLARTLVLLTVAIAAEAALAFLTTGARPQHTLTLDDLCIQATGQGQGVGQRDNP